MILSQIAWVALETWFASCTAFCQAAEDASLLDPESFKGFYKLNIKSFRASLLKEPF